MIFLSASSPSIFSVRMNGGEGDWKLFESPVLGFNRQRMSHLLRDSLCGPVWTENATTFVVQVVAWKRSSSPSCSFFIFNQFLTVLKMIFSGFLFLTCCNTHLRLLIHALKVLKWTLEVVGVFVWNFAGIIFLVGISKTNLFWLQPVSGVG